jgi:hypothetical protein
MFLHIFFFFKYLRFSLSRKSGSLLPDPVRTPGPVQAKKLGRWRKKLGRKPATPQIIRKSAVKNFWANFCKLLLKLGRN